MLRADVDIFCRMGPLCKGNSEATTREVNILCGKYSVDVSIVVREMKSVVLVFKENHTAVNMADVSTSKTLSTTDKFDCRGGIQRQRRYL